MDEVEEGEGEKESKNEKEEEKEEEKEPYLMVVLTTISLSSLRGRVSLATSRLHSSVINNNMATTRLI